MNEDRKTLSDAALWVRIALDLQEAVARDGGSAAAHVLREAQHSPHWPEEKAKRFILISRR